QVLLEQPAGAPDGVVRAPRGQTRSQGAEVVDAADHDDQGAAGRRPLAPAGDALLEALARERWRDRRRRGRVRGPAGVRRPRRRRALAHLVEPVRPGAPAAVGLGRVPGVALAGAVAERLQRLLPVALGLEDERALQVGVRADLRGLLLRG